MTSILFGGRNSSMYYILTKINSFTLNVHARLLYPNSIAVIGVPSLRSGLKEKGQLLIASCLLVSQRNHRV